MEDKNISKNIVSGFKWALIPLNREEVFKRLPHKNEDCESQDSKKGKITWPGLLLLKNIWKKAKEKRRKA